MLVPTNTTTNQHAWPSPEPLRRVARRGDLLVARGRRAVVFYDVSEPSAVKVRATAELPEHDVDKLMPLAWRDDRTVVAFGTTRWFDISLDASSATVREAGHVPEGQFIKGGTARGAEVLVSLSGNRGGLFSHLGLFRASGPEPLVKVCPETYSLIPSYSQLYVQGALLYACNSDRLAILDLSEPAAPKLVTSLELPYSLQELVALTTEGELVSYPGDVAGKRLTVVDPRELGKPIGRDGRGGHEAKVRYAKLSPSPSACAVENRRVWAAFTAKKTLSICPVELEPTSKPLVTGEVIELSSDKDLTGSKDDEFHLRWIDVRGSDLLLFAVSGRFVHYRLP